MSTSHYLDEELFCRKSISKIHEKIARQRAVFYHYSMVKRRLLYKGMATTVKQLCEIAGLDISKFSPKVKSVLNKKVSQICQASADFQKGCICVQLYSEGDNPMRWAMAHGAIVVVTRSQIDDLPCIVVDDPNEVYAAMCGYYCRLRAIPTTVVTGSIGKTTTTHMINAVYSAQFKTYCTPTNGNHLVRVGVYAQHIPYGTELFVQEISENPPFHTRYMSRLLRPNIAVLTAIDNSHIEAFGTQENIIKSVCAVTDYMSSPTDSVIINKDEFFNYDLLGNHKVITVSTKGVDADYYAQDINVTNKGISFKVVDNANRSEHPVLLHNIYAPHNVISALYAFAAGVCASVDRRNIVKGLESFRTRGIRQNVFTVDNNVIVYADCYNAVTKSMISAIDSACSIPINGKRIAVLGDIAEVGDMSDEIHRQVLEHAFGSHIDSLIVKGEHFAKALSSFDKKITDKVTVCSSNSEICKAVQSILSNDDLVLFKSSQAGHLEECIRMLWPSSYKTISKADNKPIMRWKLQTLFN